VAHNVMRETAGLAIVAIGLVGLTALTLLLAFGQRWVEAVLLLGGLTALAVGRALARYDPDADAELHNRTPVG